MEMHGVYECEQLSRIESWEREQPSSLSRAVGFFAGPLAWAARQVVPEQAMQKALEAAFGVAGAISGSDDLLAEADKLGYRAASIKELANAPLHVGDTLAAQTNTWAKGLAAAEGAMTGMAGIAGLTADIPALLILAIRTIRRVGFCYGFDTSADNERAFILYVLSAGAANSLREKGDAISEAIKIHACLDNPEGLPATDARGIDVLNKEGFNAAVRNLAKQLCINISGRKAAQTLPIVGGGVGAVMNAMFVGDVANAAIRLFQKRRLEIPSVDSKMFVAKKDA
ncbi:MAG: EcsC family protein [Candidatus Riflebacteria bacterium]|nr:EcsC family protein [Candidatus Riflebacteria bacterium]